MASKAVMVGIDKDLIELVQSENLAQLVGIFDLSGRKDALGMPVIGGDADWEAWRADNPGVAVILSVDPQKRRRALAQVYGLDRCLTIISGRASVARSAKLGGGSIVQSGAILSADAVLGAGVKVNVAASVHHDCRVGDFVTLAPGARLLGTVTVDDDCYVGAHAVVLPNLKIGRGGTVGAGAVVTRDVPAGATVMGVPAKRLN
jgi:sugar O-acyltransferase (sialic acid O-acetyltransferase NeuD family)